MTNEGSSRTDWAVLVTSVRAASRELGVFSASLVALETIIGAGEQTMLGSLLNTHHRKLPLLATIVKSGFSSDDLRHRVVSCMNKITAEIEASQTVLTIGIESVFLDAMLDRYRNKTFVCVPHDPSVDLDRVSSNLPAHAQVCDMTRFMHFAGAQSIVLAFVYGTGYHTTYTNFQTARLLGKDVRERFRTVIAVDLLGTEFSFFPQDLVEIPMENFTDFAVPEH